MNLFMQLLANPFGHGRGRRNEMISFLGEIYDKRGMRPIEVMRDAAREIRRRRNVDQNVALIMRYAKPIAYGGTVGRWFEDSPFTTAEILLGVTNRDIAKEVLAAGWDER